MRKLSKTPFLFTLILFSLQINSSYIVTSRPTTEGTDNKVIEIFYTKTGGLAKRFDNVLAKAFSHDGKYIAIGKINIKAGKDSMKGTILILDWSNMETLKTIITPKPVTALEFVPKNSGYLTSNEHLSHSNFIKLWDWHNKKVIKTFKTPGGVGIKSLTLNPKASYPKK
ncbi:WD40 repeat domain-containing protein [Candidatus Dependentiae bacterium]